jgi:predicted amidophosphoribosyltransferase
MSTPPYPRQDLGPGGTCICPRCETRVPHRRGVRCRDERCPHCGAGMLREGSEHHRNWLEKRRQTKRATLGRASEPPHTKLLDGG